LFPFIVLNTFVNITIVTLATSLVWELTSASASKAIVILLALFLCIITIAIVGEIIPRVYGVKHNIRLAQRTAYAWKIWIQVLRPFSIFIIKMGHLLEKRIEAERNSDNSGRVKATH
jgi:CBS domain containing-hemolysin-like protein